MSFTHVCGDPTDCLWTAHALADDMSHDNPNVVRLYVSQTGFVQECRLNGACTVRFEVTISMKRNVWVRYVTYSLGTVLEVQHRTYSLCHEVQKLFFSRLTE